MVLDKDSNLVTLSRPHTFTSKFYFLVAVCIMGSRSNIMICKVFLAPKVLIPVVFSQKLFEVRQCMQMWYLFCKWVNWAEKLDHTTFTNGASSLQNKTWTKCLMIILDPKSWKESGNHLVQWSYFTENFFAVLQRTKLLDFASTESTFLNSISFYLISNLIMYKIIKQTFQNHKAFILGIVYIEKRKDWHGRIQWDW